MERYNQISYGSQGSDVKKLQELLNKNGAELTVDGIFGSQTQQAVKNYQKINNLAVDGIVGPNTWGALTTPAATTTNPNTQTTSPNTNTWSYEDFQVSDSTAAAEQKRQDIASQKPGDFTYDPYEKSDTVKQAEALLQQHLTSKPGAYQSTWQTQLDETLGKILNREKFSYDINDDAMYQQLKDQYVLLGQQAAMDTMGQAQAMTGGYGNSYAQQVGQQTYQGYLQQLNDKVPELYKIALNQHNQEGQDLYNQYGLYADRDQQDYGRYRDQVGDFYTELDRLTQDARYQGEQDYGRYMDALNLAYGLHRDQVSDWQAEQDRADSDYWNQYNRDYGQYSDDRNLSYSQYRDQVSDSQWEQAFQYQQDRDQVSDSQWEQSFQYQQERDKIDDQQWQAQFDESKRQYDQSYSLSAGKSSGSSGGGDSTGGSGVSGGSSSGGGSGYDNEGLSTNQIKMMQTSLGITADGKWGAASKAAAGGRSAAEAYKLWNQGKLEGAQRVSDAAIKKFQSTLNPESAHDRVARAMYGPYTSYVAYMLEKDTSLSDPEKDYLISLYGITSSDRQYLIDKGLI